LWSTDGTTTGTLQLGTEQPNLASGTVVLGDKLIFTAADKVSGTEPWVTDGTSAGTMLLKDITKGTASSTLSGFTVLGDHVIFQNSIPASVKGPAVTQLWSTDGTTTGTLQLGTEQPNLASGTVVLGDKLIFTAADKVSGTEPWVTDGTSAGTMLLKDITKGTASSTLSGFTVLGDHVIFQNSIPASKTGP